MPDASQWGAYDVARLRLDLRIGELTAALVQEESKIRPDQAKVEALGAELDALDLQSSLISIEDFSR